MSAAGLLVKQIEAGMCLGFLAFLGQGVAESSFGGKVGKARGIESRTLAMEKQTKKVRGRASWKQEGYVPFSGGGGRF
jgi:hypothetical protein